MMEMVERVARALAWADFVYSETPESIAANGFTKEGMYVEEKFYTFARATIEEMKVPTEAMMKALRFYGMLDGDPEEAWEMTILTALDPSTPLRGS